MIFPPRSASRALALALLVACTLTAWPAAVAQSPTVPTILQNAAAANGNGTAATVTGYRLVGVQATTSGGPPTFTLNFEVSQDGSTFVATSCRPVGGGAAVTTSTATGLWRCNTSGMRFFRARISGYGASGSITALATAIGDGLIASAEDDSRQVGEWNIAHIGSAVHVAGTVNVNCTSGCTSNTTIAHVSSVLHVAIVADFAQAGTANRVCHSRASFVTTANAIVAHGGAGLRLYLCGLVLIGAGDGTTVSLVEGTGAACGTGTAAVLGSTDAANGVPISYHVMSMVQDRPWIATATAGNQLCVLTSQAATRVVGTVVYGAY